MAIADNDSPQGSGIFADGFDAQTELTNNIVFGKLGQTAVFCGDFNDLNPPIFKFNNIFSPSGTAYGGVCTDQTGINGNISADPLFADPTTGDYHLQPGSPALDVGDDTVCPASDLDGQPRPVDGDGDGVATCDMGAFELGAVPPPVTLVAIDIKPGSFPNSINPRSRGVIPVAILTTDTFDATTVDPLSIEFGPNGATEAHGRRHLEDVNGDGRLDLVLHFRTRDTGIQCGDATASLTGETFDGQAIEESDSIHTVGCKVGVWRPKIIPENPKALGLTIPPSVLIRADRVIE